MGIHRFLHIGDTHLGQPGGRNADRYAALDQILAYGERLAAAGELAAWLWPGDLGHARLPIGDSNELDVRLQRMAAHGPVILTYGNHDLPGDLEGFSRLATAWPIHVVSTPEVLRIRTATRVMARIFVLPYPHRAGLVSAGAAHASLIDEARQALDPIFLSAAADLEAGDQAGDITLAIGHVNVGGSIASVGQPQIGREIELDAALLARLGVQYVGLNHIHKHQVVHGAVYAGSICRMDYGEMELKGFIEALYDDTVVDAEPGIRWDWRFVPLAVPAQHQVEGVLTRHAFLIEAVNGAAVVLDEPTAQEAISWAGADVRCRYRYVKAEIGALDVAKIHAEFTGCRSLKLDGVPQLAHEVRAPEIAAAATLEDKAQAYCRLQGISWTPGLAAKLTSLQAQESTAVLAALSQSLALAGSQPGDVARELTEVA